MKNALVRQLCRLLILCMGTLPFSAGAGMIGTDQAAGAAQAANARDTLRGFVDRSEVREQLQNLGVGPAAAQARVNAMTDAEVAAVAGRIERLPAGGLSVWAALTALVVVELIWYYWVR